VVEQYRIYQPIDYSRINEEQIDPSLLNAVKKNTLVDGKSYAVPHVYGTEGLVVNRPRRPT
jgi:spermidine/putrescine transport system substrate-binding protein